MNIKVVIVWAVGIVIFAGLGIFGALNQDLLIDPDDYNANNYVPVDSETYQTNTCSGSLSAGNIDYSFSSSTSTGLIEKIVIKYNANAEDQDAYIAASNINTEVSNGINGVTSNFQGGINDFSLYLTIDVLNGFDSVKMNDLNSDLLKLGMLLDNITNYSTYKSALASTTGIPFSCE